MMRDTCPVNEGVQIYAKLSGNANIAVVQGAGTDRQNLPYIQAQIARREGRDLWDLSALRHAIIARPLPFSFPPFAVQNQRRKR